MEMDRLNELEFRIGECNKLLQIQLSQMSMNQISNETNLYMGGMYNGMELLMSVLENRQPMFCDLSVDGDEQTEGTEPEQEPEQVNKTISGRLK